MWTNQRWPAAREKVLRSMWAQGCSASIIADEIGVSRCAVLGKVSRLHLPERSPKPNRPRKKYTQRRPRAQATGLRAPPPVAVIRRPKQEEMTKNELRRLFEQAWRNTAINGATTNDP